MPVTDAYYGSNSARLTRAIQDFGLCNVDGAYIYSAKLRAKGFLIVAFFDPNAAESREVLRAIDSWTEELVQTKWTAVGISASDRETIKQLVDTHSLKNMTMLLDHEFYQTKLWGVSNFPSVFLVSGKTGRVMAHVRGNNADALDGVKNTLVSEVNKAVAAEESAKKADAEKKAAEEAVKKAEAEKKPAEPTNK